MTATETEPLAPATARELIAAAVAARDAGMAQAIDGASDWDKELIAQAIGWFAQTGEIFSANDIRPLLPADINARGLMGAMFQAAYNRHEIRPVGEQPSKKVTTHNKRINRWVAAGPDDDTEEMYP